MVLDLADGSALETFYRENPTRNIRDALDPAFKSRPKALEPVECVEVSGRPGMFLIPGHVGLAEDEVSLGIAQQLSESVQGLRNLPGSFDHLFKLTAQEYAADYVLVDLSPGLGAINQNLVMTSDFFTVPVSPDVFSVMAIDSLSRVIPRWSRWATSAAQLDALVNADYPFPQPNLRFLGVVVQRYRLRAGSPTEAFQQYFDELDRAIDESLVPALRDAGLMLEAQQYADAGLESMRLASISDFNTLIASSQQARKPVFELTREDLGTSGFVWETQQANIENFRQCFDTLAERIEGLTS